MKKSKSARPRRDKRGRFVSSGPSGSVATFDYHELVLSGRGKTLLGVQGDHVSALSMLVRGMTRIYRHLFEEINHSHYSTAISNRDKAINFACQLGKLDPDPDPKTNKNLDKYIKKINKLFDQYDDDRHFKQDIDYRIQKVKRESTVEGFQKSDEEDVKRILMSSGLSIDEKRKLILDLFFNVKEFDTAIFKEMTKFLAKVIISKEGFFDQKNIDRLVSVVCKRAIKEKIDSASKNIQELGKLYHANGMLINKLTADIASASIDYYNKLPGTAFMKIRKRDALGEPKIRPRKIGVEQVALKYLDERYYEKSNVKLSENSESFTSFLSSNRKRKASAINQAGSTDHFQELIYHIYQLIDYCKIRKDYIPDLAECGPHDRTNDLEKLGEMMARHLFLFFHCYPEVAAEYDCDLESDDIEEYEKLNPIRIAYANKFFQDWGLEGFSEAAKKNIVLKKYNNAFNHYMVGKAFPVSELIRTTVSTRRSSPMPGNKAVHPTFLEPASPEKLGSPDANSGPQATSPSGLKP